MSLPEFGINPLPGTRCCYNCERWDGSYADDFHNLIGKCNAHGRWGTFFYVYCDDFAGLMDVGHLGNASHYPEPPERGGPIADEDSRNFSPIFKENNR